MRRWRSTNLPRTPGLCPQVVFSSFSSMYAPMLHHSITSLSLYSLVCSRLGKRSFVLIHFGTFSLSTLYLASHFPATLLSLLLQLAFPLDPFPSLWNSLSLSSFVLHSTGFLVSVFLDRWSSKPHLTPSSFFYTEQGYTFRQSIRSVYRWFAWFYILRHHARQGERSTVSTFLPHLTISISIQSLSKTETFLF
ncbi:hypothetical protein F4806DRAFT_295715 [Annulohypoxylon nitens]|nr:hypothetical protein F4806DRAFT_295715 [Annulohypoxylon nitens]